MSRIAHAAALLVLLGSTGAAGAEPDPEDPPLCRQAIETRPDTTALEALADEEKRLATEARRARRAARKVMRETLGAGAGARAKLPEYEAHVAREAEAKRRGKVLCYCRERRGDPHRQDCELLDPMVIR
ncbi:MAG: hypothetical protein ACQGVC_00465 [Myxococcota bacterium]